MEIIVNGKSEEVNSGETLSVMITRKEIPAEGLVIVVGDDVVPSDVWDSTVLVDGSHIELLNFVSGG